jgi:two-component system, LytTR family, sensor kinase
MSGPDTQFSESARRQPHVNPRVALLSILGFWLFYFIMNTLRMLHETAAEQLASLPKRAVVVLIGVLLSYFLYLILRPLDNRSLPTRIAAAFLASVPVAIAYAAVNYAIFFEFYPSDQLVKDIAKYPEKIWPAWKMIIYAASEWYFFIVAWSVLYIALSYANAVRAMEQEAARYQAEAQAAQLRALRYQINPHFLFNTLNSLSSLVLKDRREEAEKMIMTLSTFFRTTLTTDTIDDVTLAEEIKLQQLYLEIEKVRFPERLQTVIDIPADLESALVPGLILQPLIENAIKYGVSRTTRPVIVSIRAWEEAGRLHLAVIDDGDSATAQSASPNGHGVGLRNVQDRLAARFGAAASCTHGLRASGGYRVELVLPYVSGASHHG